MTEKKKPGRVGILSAFIDPLLFAGGKRVFQIADDVVAYFGVKYDKKKVVNNIRSRITFLTTRKGYRFEKNSLKHVKLVKFENPGAEKTVLAAQTVAEGVPVNAPVSVPKPE